MNNNIDKIKSLIAELIELIGEDVSREGIKKTWFECASRCWSGKL